MSETARMLRSDEPIMLDWDKFKQTDFCKQFQAVTGSGPLWRVFMEGHIAATERAAATHESVNPASDQERQEGSPGAGAMGAVLEYRELIRKALP